MPARRRAGIRVLLSSESWQTHGLLRGPDPPIRRASSTYLLRRYPKARGDLEARLPAWRDAAKAIAGLDVGLDDAEYVGGVLWYGLTHRGAEGNVAEQQRVIVDRLVKWATRDGGDSSQVARAIRAVLEEYLPGM
jgi:hypothetical protein